MPCIDLGFDRTAQVYKLFKANQSDPTIPSSYHIYRDFDKILRGMNGDRTNGLLTGISVSRFVSEALFARIDEEIEKEGIRFVRYVDDYEIFIFNEKELQKTQSTITNIFKLTKKYLKSEITNSITNSNNDLAKIVFLEEYKSRLTKKAKRQMIATANSWILYYQLYYNDYINKDTFSRKSGIKHNLVFYNRLKHDHFSFYVK